MIELPRFLPATGLEITEGRENEAWHNGYSFGMKQGAGEVIRYLQENINDEMVGGTDAHEIKMFVFDLWKSICIDERYYQVRLPEEIPPFDPD